ncbi:MAG: response regulator [Chitinophagaceae bacterium]
MRPLKILLAEDDADDQQFFMDFLRDRNDIALLPAVENGEELFLYLDGHSALPDAIILDQNMPKCNGLQTLSLIKQTERYAGIPVMLYSTFADETLLSKSKVAGAILVMSKPSTSAEYHNLIDEFLAVIG